MSEDERLSQKDMVAARLRDLSAKQIEDLEDRLPHITNLLERDQVLKEIDALEQIADEANKRAEEIISEYYQEEKCSFMEDDNEKRNED
jgi:hypothetical protein|tara:strand:+ start:1345 stop:1611 length:267 start_codon:yes stop_codon:yes gene_type:complete